MSYFCFWKGLYGTIYIGNSIKMFETTFSCSSDYSKIYTCACITRKKKTHTNRKWENRDIWLLTNHCMFYSNRLHLSLCFAFKQAIEYLQICYVCKLISSTVCWWLFPLKARHILDEIFLFYFVRFQIVALSLIVFMWI